MNLSIIVAIDQNFAIGKDNQLPWYLPEDLKYFKRVTTGHTLIMGRKTYDSMGKALPNRRNIVISRQKNLLLKDAEVVHSLDEALSLCSDDKETFIIGGAEVFKQAILLVKSLYITKIDHTFEADTYLQGFNLKEWKEVYREDKKPDEKNHFSYSFIRYEKA
ncbi:Dihydrofolate reductase [Arcticibacter svalbardensis MN12-7]|uniref:Dihydrofolate reductase n=1 Tax=Arcticibacter svalbardensis MN12-7 TaxID=1150600 RepID=R9GN39_9SPHI|nr:dihydrofolate reductase [Arcticibacter svalbardensis]EOR93242.1 Dihydrofolate reductase [Arcticibacter svalbardensis MN12-7]